MILRFALIAIVFLLPLTFAGVPASSPSSAQGQVNFSEHIAPIVFNRCATCHRPGEAAPFSLLSYEDVRKRGKLIATVTQSRYMPPWLGSTEMGSFRDDRRLTDAEVRTIQNWVQAGMPEGDPSKMPKAPTFTPGWQLGQPDLIVRMQEPFEIPADGPDVFRNFAIKLNVTEQRWVRAVEFRSSAKASHHALFFLDQTGEAVKADEADPRPGFTGMNFLGAGAAARNAVGERQGQGLGQRLGQRQGRGGALAALGGRTGLGGWAVGGSPSGLPEGLARSLPAGSDLILQMHFHPTGKVEREQATLGIYFSEKPPTRTLTALQMPPIFGALAGIDIPAGDKQFKISDSFVLPIDAEVVSAGAHAHYLAKEMRMTATLPDGKKKELFLIADWNFNWQERYYFAAPIRLPKGTRVDVEISYDNTSTNPRNPSNPPKRVTFGEQSTDEMGAMTIELVPVREGDMPAYTAAVQEHVQNAVVDTVARGLRGLLRGR
jgi:mono/diheme cytochrome c family protein